MKRSWLIGAIALVQFVSTGVSAQNEDCIPLIQQVAAAAGYHGEEDTFQREVPEAYQRFAGIYIGRREGRRCVAVVIANPSSRGHANVRLMSGEPIVVNMGRGPVSVPPMISDRLSGWVGEDGRMTVNSPNDGVNYLYTFTYRANGGLDLTYTSSRGRVGYQAHISLERIPNPFGIQATQATPRRR